MQYSTGANYNYTTATLTTIITSPDQLKRGKLFIGVRSHAGGNLEQLKGA